jgi:L-lactate dehydrogenase complex protein LldG
MINFESNNESREVILNSIRDHLAASARHDAVFKDTNSHHVPLFEANGSALTNKTNGSLIDVFRENLEAVDGNCIVAAGELEVVQALRTIISSLRETPLRPRRIALSDAPILQHLASQIEQEVEEIEIAPDAAQLFAYDLGITTVQGAIAETGTLVLNSALERHRLVSLLPPVHIAIVDSSQICLTLGEALTALRVSDGELSPTITFVTGPSRTADIELTLAIGVHGPQRLYVIINSGPKLGTWGPHAVSAVRKDRPTN